jgi:thiosulfate/3-mercaptopyruvate sulfurtransferase
MTGLLVTPDWLNAALARGDIKVVDASWYLPAQNRDAKAEFEAGHIPGAVYFDIDAIADQNTDLPHMLPDASAFAEAAGALGLSDTDTIIVYDGLGLFSAPRAWWTLRVFGAKDVRLLSGGFPAWLRAGFPSEAGWPDPEPAQFDARLDPNVTVDYATVLALLHDNAATIVDARPAPRFIGEEAGVDLEQPLVSTCGSGVTAAALNFALAAIGKTDVTLYDGSWAEWGARPGAPIRTIEPE